MKQNELFVKLERYSVIPVISIESIDLALPLADSLAMGGLPVVEITYRTGNASEVIRILKKERPEMLVGAGTILTKKQLRQAVDSGADFGVAPGINEAVIEEALKTGFTFSPGVITPTDIEKALSFGLSYLKFFPAEAGGGVEMLKAIYAPYAHLGIRFNPTGGINLQNLENYLKLEAVYAVGGSWIAKRDLISAGKWEEIGENARKVCEVVKRIREHKEE